MGILGSFGNQSSSSRNSGESFVDPAQQGFFKSLYRQGQRALNRYQPGQLRDQNRPQIWGMKQDFQDMGALTDPRQQIRAQTQSLEAGLGRTFREQLMPSIQSNAMLAGGFGGGRQGVAEGVAAGQIADAYVEGRGQIVANANQTAMQAAGLRQDQARSIYDLGMASTDFAPLMQMRSLLGNANILNRTTGKQSSSGWEISI